MSGRSARRMDEKMGISSHYGDSPPPPHFISLSHVPSGPTLAEDDGGVPKVSFRFLFLHQRTNGGSKANSWSGGQSIPPAGYSAIEAAEAPNVLSEI